MLMQCACHSNSLTVVRTHHASWQTAAGAADVVEDMIHLAVRLGGFPGLALHRHGIDRIGRAQLVPCHQSRSRITPIFRTGEIQYGTMPVFHDETHHVGHRGPLVHADDGYATAIGGRHQSQTILHADTAMRGSDDHTRLHDLRTASRRKHDVSRREEDKRINVHLIERTA